VHDVGRSSKIGRMDGHDVDGRMVITLGLVVSGVVLIGVGLAVGVEVVAVIGFASIGLGGYSQRVFRRAPRPLEAPAQTALPAVHRVAEQASPRERPAASRLGDDPFRDPPRGPVIVAQPTAAAPAPAVVVPGDPADRPKLLGDR
jgi:hypothetical protein